MKKSIASYKSLPSEYSLVRNVSEETSYSGGLEYRILSIDVVCDAQGCLYQRRYENICTAEANGRPCFTERDVLIKFPADGVITSVMRLNPDVILKENSGIGHDPVMFEYAKMNKTNTFNGGYELVINGRCFYILNVAIHGGSGYGANYPYNVRYYLVNKDFWAEKRDQYLMVHDSILPEAWEYYDNHGINLGESSQFTGTESERTMKLKQALLCMNEEILDSYASSFEE